MNLPVNASFGICSFEPVRLFQPLKSLLPASEAAPVKDVLPPSLLLNISKFQIFYLRGSARGGWGTDVQISAPAAPGLPAFPAAQARAVGCAGIAAAE